MILANLPTGETARFDLQDADQAREFRDLVRSQKITALSILNNGTQFSLPLPRKFKPRPFFDGELLYNKAGDLIGERIFVFAGTVRVNLSITYTSNLIRCDLLKVGKMRYNPSLAGGG